MSVWRLLKEYVREFEIANDVIFSDGSWQRVKKLEADIEAEHSKELTETSTSYQETLHRLRSQNTSLLVMLQRTMSAAHVQAVDSHTHRAELKDDNTIEVTALGS